MSEDDINNYSSSNSGQSLIGAGIVFLSSPLPSVVLSRIALKSSIEEHAFIEVSNSLALVLILALKVLILEGISVPSSVCLITYQSVSHKIL